LEAKPELLSITDPANLDSANPAVSTAASVKGEEDQADQKAKAILYLASVGCAGCYPGIEEAILSSLDDCTEAVRFAAAQALRSSATMPCKNCCRSACCGPKVREKLMKLAYETDSQGCYLESSDRVRRMARLALANCTCVPEKPGTAQQRLPEEGPRPEESPTPAAGPTPPPAPATASVMRPYSRSASTASPIVARRAAAPSPPVQPLSYEQAVDTFARNGPATIQQLVSPAVGGNINPAAAHVIQPRIISIQFPDCNCK
jgi:hypothetical protein